MDAESALRREIAAYNSHDLDRWLACYSDDAVVYDPTSPAPLRGKAARRANEEPFLRAFPDAEVKPLRIVAHGDSVALEAVITGTHQGPLQDGARTIPLTGRRIELRAAAWYRVNDQGLITEERIYADPAHFAAQVGLGR